MQLVGCSSVSLNEPQNNTREIAYNWLDDSSKSDVLDWDKASVEEVIFNEEHLVATETDIADIKDIETYKITFTTQKDELIGPIAVYLDKNNLNVLGVDFKE